MHPNVPTIILIIKKLLKKKSLLEFQRIKLLKKFNLSLEKLKDLKFIAKSKINSKYL